MVALQPEHISTYALKIEAGTDFAKKSISIDDDLEADLYLRASEKLVALGFVHYEISNFAKPGKESRHNKLYWENSDTIGVGLSAASYFQGRRFKNTRNLPQYIEAVENKKSPVIEESQLEESARLQEQMMLGLRLREGVEESLVYRLDKPIFRKFLDENLAFVEEGRYRLTPQGWLLSNQLFQFLV